MRTTTKIIDELWQKGEAGFETGSNNKYKVVLSKINGLFDIVIYSDFEAIGFITLKKEEKGLYSVVNDTKINPHPGFINTPGHGIEVKGAFRKRGLGAALLSLGIGVAQRDWQRKRTDGLFKVVVSNITPLGLGCYRNFGFTITEGMSVSTGYYTDSNNVPELNILKSKVFYFARLLKRILT